MNKIKWSILLLRKQKFQYSITFYEYSITDRSRAEKLWLVCGVTGDVMLCHRERDIHPSQKLYATIHSEEMTYLTIVFSANVNFQQLYVFAMNNKTSPPSTNPTKKCRALFPYFPSLESRLAGEHTVHWTLFSTQQ
jgi:hypothetical protein